MADEALEAGQLVIAAQVADAFLLAGLSFGAGFGGHTGEPRGAWIGRGGVAASAVSKDRAAGGARGLSGVQRDLLLASGARAEQEEQKNNWELATQERAPIIRFSGTALR